MQIYWNNMEIYGFSFKNSYLIWVVDSIFLLGEGAYNLSGSDEEGKIFPSR